ncbi:hypothetical protein IWW51_005353 [Coemansia sp. RSA 2702]|nr:hypothetical protein IWW51_005353 [Coemansia sp. RSA 2702]
MEVRQQHKLKRMLRRIRASRRQTALRTPRSSARLHAARSKAAMPSLQLPDAEAVEDTSDDRGEWSDDEDGMVRKMDVTMEIGDEPSDEELGRRVARLINQIFGPQPEVDGKQVAIHQLSGAMTNSVYMVTVTPAPAELPAKYLLRVYGAGVDEFLSREKELYWLSQLTALGFGPRLYGIFGNGRLEEYLESTTLRRDDIRKAATSKHIARRMSELHALVSYYRPSRDKPQPELWANIESWLRLARRKWDRISAVCARHEECTGILARWDDVERLAARLQRAVEAANSPVVFAHDDLQYGNILRLQDTGELVVVDFEYAGYNYRGFDIANHFCEWMADYHREADPHLLDEAAYPTDDERAVFLRTYIKSGAFLKANIPADAGVVESDAHAYELRAVNLSEERIRAEVAAMEREVTPFVPASHLHWGLWGLLQSASSDIDFDYVAYASQRLTLFLRQADALAE